MSHLTDVLSADIVQNDVLRHAIDCSMEGIALLDAAGLYSYMNPAHAAMYGFAPDELLGKSWRELYEPMVIATIEQHYFPIVLAEGAWRGELVGRTKHGALMDVEISLTLLKGAQGEPTGLICTCRDISERKQVEQALRQSEERHELAIRAAHLGVFEHDHRVGMLYWSSTMRQIYGVGSDAPASFDAYIASIHPDDRASILPAIQRAHAVDGDGRYAVKHRIVRPNGVVRWVSIQSQTYFEGTGGGRRPLKTMGVMADVTEQEEAEAVLRRDQADLEYLVAQRTKAMTAAMQTLQTENRIRQRLETEREKLLARVQEGQSRLQALSHSLLSMQETERQALARDLHDEVGQALTAVRSNLLMIHHAPKDHTILPTVADSVAIVDQMLDAVRNLALNLRPSMLDDLGLIPTLRWYFSRQLDRFKLKGTLRTTTTTSKYEDIVQIACFRVAQEALTNVARHAKASRVSLNLCERKDVLTLTVCDNGIGFDLQQVRKRVKQGENLGLVGMEERVHLVDGVFHITTGHGTGTMVQATFPLSPEHRPSRRRRTP